MAVALLAMAMYGRDSGSGNGSDDGSGNGSGTGTVGALGVVTVSDDGSVAAMEAGLQHQSADGLIVYDCRWYHIHSGLVMVVVMIVTTPIAIIMTMVVAMVVTTSMAMVVAMVGERQ